MRRVQIQLGYRWRFEMRRMSISKRVFFESPLFKKPVTFLLLAHIYCAYKSGPVPANLLKRVPAAISNWRCYECKRCHLCGGKDDSVRKSLYGLFGVPLHLRFLHSLGSLFTRLRLRLKRWSS